MHLRPQILALLAAAAPLIASAQPTTASAKSSEESTLLREATERANNREYDAALVRLERCVALVPTSYTCFKKLGSVHGKLSARDASAADYEKALTYYRKYLALAPRDDPDRNKVQKIVEDADAQRP